MNKYLLLAIMMLFGMALKAQKDSTSTYQNTANRLMETDRKIRNAARLLTEQVKREAAMLQFERDALWEMSGGQGLSIPPENPTRGWGGSSLHRKIDLPPMPPPPSAALTPFAPYDGDY